MIDYQMMSRNVRGFMSLFHSDKPVVCKVHGFCVAGGTDMALCSDLLVIEDDAQDRLPAGARLGRRRRRRCGRTGSAPSGPSGCCSPATRSTATRRSSGASRPRRAPAAELDERFEALLERIARLPINQLVMMKLLVNQTLYAQGLHATQVARRLLRRHRPPHAGGLRVPASAPPRPASRRRCASATSRSATTEGSNEQGLRRGGDRRRCRRGGVRGGPRGRGLEGRHLRARAGRRRVRLLGLRPLEDAAAAG